MRSQGLLLASQWLLLQAALGSRPEDSDAELLGPEPRPGSAYPVPSYLEDTFPGSGPKVKKIWKSLEGSEDKLEKMDDGGLFFKLVGPAGTGKTWNFEYDLKDNGAPYKLELLPEPDKPIERSATTSLTFKPSQAVEQVKLEARFIEDLKRSPEYLEEGINYAGRITVSGGNKTKPRYILVPGTKTYDIGGMTGDPHASERIGPACSKVIMAITTAVVVAMRATGNPFFVRGLFASNHQLIEDLHNRWTLATYMWDQAYAAFTGRERATYAQYVRKFMPALHEQPCFNNLGKTGTGRCHAHMSEYFTPPESIIYVGAARWKPLAPPVAFYAKICEDIKDMEKANKYDLWKKATKDIDCKHVREGGPLK